MSNEHEPATGFTLFPDAILRVCPAPPARPRAFLPWGTTQSQAQSLRAAGFATVPALSAAHAPGAEADAEAARLRCTHVAHDGMAVALQLTGGMAVTLPPTHGMAVAVQLNDGTPVALSPE